MLRKTNTHRLTGRPAMLALLVVAAVAGALSGGLFWGMAEAPSADSRFLAAVSVPYPDGYAGHVLAAGHWSCAALHKGWTIPRLIEEGARTGLVGDLYTRQGVEDIVRNAAELLCPEAPRTDLIQP